MDGLFAHVTAPEDGTVTIELLGDLDLATRDRLGSAIQAALSDRPRLVVVDLGGVRVLDSAGIGALVTGWKTTRNAGGDLVLRNPSRLAYWQLELTGLLEVFGNPQPPG